MKTTLTPEPRNQLQQLQTAKRLLTISLVLSLSACGSIRYNGFSNADTIADLFSFTESESSASPTSTEEAAQTEIVAKQQAKSTNTDESKLENVSQAESSSEAMNAEVEEITVQETATEQVVIAESGVKETENELAAKDVSVSVAVSQAVANVTHEPLKISSNQGPELTPAVDAQTQQLDTTQNKANDKLAGSAKMDEQTRMNVASVAEVNRLTEENPTAAISSDYQVLPEVQSEVAEISVPNEILLLATPAEYRPEVSEYGMWEIAQGEDSLYRENCTLASATMQVAFDNYSTQVWLKVVGDDLLVNSTTNIDINKPRVGIKLDNGPVLAFNKKHFNTSAVWSGNLTTVLKRYKELSVSLTGNELGGRIQEVTVELDDLKRAYSEYTKCNATTQIGSL